MNRKTVNGKQRQRLAGGILLLAMVFAAVFAPWLAPADPLKPDLAMCLAPPSGCHLLGTDQLGRCVFSRVMHGTRTSLGGALTASLLALLMGAGMGITAALGPKWLKLPVTALIDMALALPGLILALVIAGLLGASMQSLVIGLALAGWPWWARFVRSLTLSAWEKEFVLAGRVGGVRWGRLLLRYILPQMQAPMLAAATLKTGWIILAFSGLSYLGLGPPPPSPEWGSMLQEAGIYMTRAPWMMLAPGAAITVAVLALNLLGEGLEGSGSP
ncbi:MAG: ABC transporter permease [Desulfobacteraceae bacterium]|jgi:ABC-type dipeptide/oligopeptide/nickel transport system permease subunit|nr:MAG: ABC transporter permease [Desulfobacteraceae bacterium]